MEAQRRWDAATYHSASDVQEARLESLLDALSLSGDESVLDAGCGTGRGTLRILERVPRGRVIAVDSNPQMVEHARRTLGDRVTVLLADLTALDLDEQVDAVISNAVFHWVIDQDRLFSRMHAALRPGGTLIAGYGGCGNLGGFLAIAASVAAEEPFAPYLRDYEPAWRFRGPEEAAASCRQPDSRTCAQSSTRSSRARETRRATPAPRRSSAIWSSSQTSCTTPSSTG